MTYDSTADTLQHIRRVNELVLEMAMSLIRRAVEHDQSKLEEPEKSAFDKYTPLLKDLTYGSDEYKACLREMKPALDHHYLMNEHHPEFNEHGINGMTLIDLIEMLCDWKAASERHSDGSILKSLEINRKRFDISDQLFEVLQNTVGRSLLGG